MRTMNDERQKTEFEEHHWNPLQRTKEYKEHKEHVNHVEEKGASEHEEHQQPQKGSWS